MNGALRNGVEAALARIVCFSADATRLAAIADSLRCTGFTASTADKTDDCLRLLAAAAADICLVDLATGSVALAALRTIRGRHPLLPIAALCVSGQSDVAEQAKRSGAADVLAWPAPSRDLATLLINTHERATSSPSSRDELSVEEPLISQSPAMRHVAELVEEAARSRAGVCVSGEPGSGRTLIGKTIHSLGESLGTRPFVVEDCADAPQELERRLFGVVPLPPHVPATTASFGPGQISTTSALARANSGTLLLRNVVDAPARVQARLSRFLRDREAIIGSATRTVVELDVQPIATLDPGADAALADGRLRRDLYKQLAQISIDMPALRRRREDIAPLALYFLREICAARTGDPKAFSRSALQVMTALPWSGNAAELRSVLGTLVEAVAGPVIHLEHLLAHVSLDGIGEPVDTGATLRDARARFERDCISAVLIRHCGRVPEAARALGIQRTNLYRKIRQLNVARSLLSAKR